MSEMGDQTYWEIIIHPSTCVEVFADRIVDYFSSTIEYMEYSPEPSPFYIYYDDSTWQSCCGFDISQIRQSQNLQVVVRLPTSDFHPQNLIDLLQQLAQALSEEGEVVGFCYHIEQKLNQDWIRAYQDSIQPLECGRFYIRPSWCERGGKNLCDIVIDPALAFGSGHHASTFMCLEMLSVLDLKQKTLLDVGCGSGILSIAASKLGAYVYACDTDEFAIEQTKKNALQNQSELRGAWCGSIQDTPNSVPQKYDVIVANIVAFVLKLLRDDFKMKLKDGGILILSGILDEYKSDIMSAFDDFEALEVYSKDEWIALKLCKFS